MPAHLDQPEADASNAVWYLGIDFGTTGVSAVLLNYSLRQRYPIFWSQDIAIKPEELRTVTSQFATRSSGEAIFRLPAITYSGPTSRDVPPERFYNVQLPVAPFAVGSLASALANNQPGILLENFKPYLNIGIPFYYAKRHEWEPTLQLSGQQVVSLYCVRQALQALLATLTPNSTLPNAMLKVGAKGLAVETLAIALQQLEGVILGCPAAWGDTYRFNLREAVLEAKLVQSPEEIFFLEDAIAPILAALPSSKLGEAGVEKRQEEIFSSTTPATPALKSGGTLVINIGATTTEIALVDLPDDLQDLTYSDFRVYSLPYAGNAIDQDIFCQLLYPQLSVEQHQQLSLPNDLELPQPAQPDARRRDRLALLLPSSPLGQALLKASGYLKLILQHKDEFTLKLGKEQWTLRRLDLETRVVLPFVQPLDRTLRTLLIETGISEQGIYQVFCLGGTAGLGALQTWIKQRLPNATLIQDADSPNRSWVAAGLASLPLYPQVLNRFQQQFSDYFLLLELLRAFPETTSESADRPYSIKEIMQQLERRGLNTGACYDRLVCLVEGQLPVGLVPPINGDSLLSQESKQNLHYSTLSATPQLFSKEGERYRPNPRQQKNLRHYLDIVLSRTCQKFEEPLIVKLGVKDC
jgi:hypothetical protein